MKWDGHTHSPFCRHGSTAPLEQYAMAANAHGCVRLSVTEHAPLPPHWVDDAALCAMDVGELDAYIACVQRVREQYAGVLDVCVGIELDYLSGNVGFMENIVHRIDGALHDVIVSVHFVPGRNGTMRCIDYTPEYVRTHVLPAYGTMDRLVEAYYDEVEQAIASVSMVSGLPSRVRLGHVEVIDKFRAVLPPYDRAYCDERLLRLVPMLAHYGVGIDLNTAGLRKPHCQRVYATQSFVDACRKADVPIVFGSDAHDPSEVAYGWDVAMLMMQ
jgi:histidinol-phosphatase (PHP family)